jgi:DNA-directed RNA polymerase subunit RPC12/RpoP
MSDPIDLLCEHCGQTFSVFLHEMAEQNAKVVCPHCGKPVAVPQSVKKN